MSDEKTHKGKLEKVETKKAASGKIFYKMQVGKLWFSSFENPTDFLQDSIEVTYTEKENPNGTHPFKNVIEGGIKAVEEEDVPEDAPVKTSISTPSYGMGAFLGMTSNQAIQLLKHEWVNMSELDFDKAEKQYKKLVRTLFKWNTELKEELANE